MKRHITLTAALTLLGASNDCMVWCPRANQCTAAFIHLNSY